MLALLTATAAAPDRDPITPRYTSEDRARELAANVSSGSGPLPGALADANLQTTYIIPRAFLLGAQKCGTSAAFQTMTKDPHLLRPRLLPGDPAWMQKEPPCEPHAICMQTARSRHTYNVAIAPTCFYCIY